jgi:DNA-binding transcriptional LysR family regulator
MDHRYKKFLAVANLGSFSKAAKSLKVSQPAITLAIASLERSIGVKFFIKKKNIIKLSAEGKLVADSAKKLLIIEEKLTKDIKDLSSSPTYQFGVIDSIAYLLYSSAKEHKVLNGLEIMVDNSRKIINNIISEKIDGGLITGQASGLTKDISIHKLHNEKFVFVRSPKLSKLKNSNKIDDWLAFNQDSTTYSHFIKIFNKIGLKVKPIFYSTSLDLLKDMALSGKGSALLPYHLVCHHIDQGKLIIIPTEPLTRPIWAIFRKKNSKAKLSHLTDQVNSMLRTHN